MTDMLARFSDVTIALFVGPDRITQMSEMLLSPVTLGAIFV